MNKLWKWANGNLHVFLNTYVFQTWDLPVYSFTKLMINGLPMGVASRLIDLLHCMNKFYWSGGYIFHHPYINYFNHVITVRSLLRVTRTFQVVKSFDPIPISSPVYLFTKLMIKGLPVGVSSRLIDWLGIILFLWQVNNSCVTTLILLPFIMAQVFKRNNAT